VPGAELVVISILAVVRRRVVIGGSAREVRMIVVVSDMLRRISRRHRIIGLKLTDRRKR
jgi:hypothetical protein